MQNDIFLVLRGGAAAIFCALLFAGYYLLRHSRELFGVDPNIPSETGSARSYGKVQVFALWAHALAGSAAFALFLH